MKKFLTKIVATALTLAGVIGMVIPAGASYADPVHYDPCDSRLGQAVLEANNCPGTSEHTDGDVGDVVFSIGNAIIGVASIVAVVVIVVGGVRYMTSAGDAGKLQKAKNTILYAAISLVICGLAAVIVNFAVRAVVRSQAAQQYTSETACKNAGYTWNGTKCQ